MVGLHHLTQALGLHMGINLSRGNVSVAKHLLDGAEICPALQQVAREAVAQHVGREFCSVEPCLTAQGLEFEREMLPRQVSGGTGRREQPPRPRHSGFPQG